MEWLSVLLDLTDASLTAIGLVAIWYAPVSAWGRAKPSTADELERFLSRAARLAEARAQAV